MERTHRDRRLIPSNRADSAPHPMEYERRHDRWMMKQVVWIGAWLFVVIALIAAMVNLFCEPQVPGLLIGSADFTVALLLVIVLAGNQAFFRK